MAGTVSHSLVAALRRVPIFAEFDDRGLLELVGASCNFFWPEGTLVFETGEESDALFVVVSGCVRIADVDGGNEVVVARTRPGEFFGEHSLLLEQTHSKRAVAEEDSELMVLLKDSFDELLAGRPDLDEQLRRRIDERLAEAESAEPPV